MDEIQKILNNPYKMQQFNTVIRNYTTFNDFNDLVDKKHNFRPIFYQRLDIPNIQIRELNEVVEFYDAYMAFIGDDRRFYRYS
jgi:ribosome-interacting GTPase 1